MEQNPLDVIVIGGGLSGLTAGYKLSQSGARVRVLEAQMTPGGYAQTEVVNGVRIERGPHTFPATADVIFELAEELGLQSELTQTQPTAHNRFIVRNGTIHAIPKSIWAFVRTPLLSLWGKLQVVLEPLRSGRTTHKDSVHDLFSRRIGHEAATVLAGSFVSGVYAGDAQALSARASFPLLWRFEQVAGSLFIGAWRHFSKRAKERRSAGISPRRGLFSFSNGLGLLTSTLAERLDDALTLNAHVDEVAYANDRWHVTCGDRSFTAAKLIVATPPHHAAVLLKSSAPNVAVLLAEIPMAPIAVVHLMYNCRLPTLPNGFGMLFSPYEKAKTLGVLFPSRLFSNRAPENGELLTAFVGGVHNPAVLAYDDDKLIATVRNDIDGLLEIDVAPSSTHIHRNAQGIPQFNHGHLARNEHLSASLTAHAGLFLAGNYLGGVGLKDAIKSGLDASDAALAGGQ
jgi:oxygen-dependent protoporphyrinogen oxidase